MSKTTVLVAALLLGCAAGNARPGALQPGPLLTVTALTAYVNGELPGRYRRSHDLPGAKYALWSYERMCIVDAAIWVRTRAGDHVNCNWRSPR